jgi:hypothetical protein
MIIFHSVIKSLCRPLPFTKIIVVTHKTRVDPAPAIVLAVVDTSPLTIIGLG